MNTAGEILLLEAYVQHSCVININISGSFVFSSPWVYGTANRQKVPEGTHKKNPTCLDQFESQTIYRNYQLHRYRIQKCLITEALLPLLHIVEHLSGLYIFLFPSCFLFLCLKYF